MRAPVRGAQVALAPIAENRDDVVPGAEFFRDPHFMVGPFTTGQLYSLPMIILGALLIWYTQRAAPSLSRQ